MNVNFYVSDYVLAWNLLFRPSISEEIQDLKTRLYKNYSKDYLKLEKENVEMLKYTKDFIPDDDTIYNFVINSEEFQKVKKQTEKYRMFLMKIWDTNNRQISKELEELLKFKIENEYTILVIHPHFNNIEYLVKNPKKNIVWGKPEDMEDGLKAIIRILFTIIKYELTDFHEDNKEMVQALIDLVVSNEIYTRITKKSKYDEGLKRFKLLKKQIYPYFLMYQGCDHDDMTSYMRRDSLPFNIDEYPIDKRIEKLDFYGFVDFCCKNQKYIIRLGDLDIN